MISRYFFIMDSGTATGTPCYFLADTNQSGNPSSATNTVNITGAANATVNIMISSLTNSNSAGLVQVNGTAVFQNQQFSVVLSASGTGSFTVTISGDASQTGTAVRVVFTIMGVSAGQLTSPDTKQESKVF